MLYSVSLWEKGEWHHYSKANKTEQINSTGTKILMNTQVLVTTLHSSTPGFLLNTRLAMLICCARILLLFEHPYITSITLYNTLQVLLSHRLVQKRFLEFSSRTYITFSHHYQCESTPQHRRYWNYQCYIVLL